MRPFTEINHYDTYTTKIRVQFLALAQQDFECEVMSVDWTSEVMSIDWTSEVMSIDWNSEVMSIDWTSGPLNFAASTDRLFVSLHDVTVTLSSRENGGLDNSQR